MTTAIPAPLQAHMDGETTTLAEGLRIQRLDGAVFAFTSASEAATVAGTLYSPDQGLDVSSIATSAGLGVDTLELTTIDDGSLFTRAQILGGVWQSAAFSLIRYNWASPADGYEPLLAGTIGHVGLREGAVVVELRGLQQYLQQAVGNVTTRTCRARFADFPAANGNNRCRLAVAGFTDTPLTVTGAVDARTFDASAGGGAPGDTSYTSVSLLAHFDGVNNASTFTDTSPSPKTLTAAGDARLTTGRQRFGSASLALDGAGDFVDIASSAAFALAGEFCVEAFVWADAATAAWSRLIENEAFDTTGGWHLSFNGTDSPGSRRLGFQVGFNGGGGARIDTDAAFPTGQWVHFAVTRSSGVVRLFVSGAQQTATLSTAEVFTSTKMRIGATVGTAGNFFTGGLDELRVTKGVARYTASFAPPTSAFFDNAPSGPPARPDDYYGEGLVRWLTGANAGVLCKVQGYTSAGRFTLAQALPSAVTVGDTLTAVAGCRKRLLEDCKTKFGNVLNFRGEPHLPGIDKLTAAGTPSV